MKTGAMKVYQRKDVSKPYFNVKLETWSYKKCIKKCKVGKVAVKYFESDFVEK
jgi:hypothetical protein